MLPSRPSVAYFCAEFALADEIPIFAGGLGVLAGDYLLEAAKQGYPMTAIGLLYRQGYFQQSISEHGRQVERYPEYKPSQVGLSLVKDANQQPVNIQLPYKHRSINIHIWQYQVAATTLYLLDTDIDGNAETDRAITQRLYGGEKYNRIKQEYVLGIGGVTLLQHLKLQPDLYHLNEGHSAFAVFALAEQLMREQSLTFNQAMDQARQQIVFTNHTIVPAGQDVFDTQDVIRCLEAFADKAEIPIRAILRQGMDPDQPETFSMTYLALNSSTRVTAVSQLHGHVAKSIWPGYRFSAITNGVHLPRWVAENLQDATDGMQLPALRDMPAHTLWELHQVNKLRLLELVKQETGRQLRTDALTIAWARRFALYKRPTLMLQQITKLRRLAADGQHLQIVIAGKAHPHDEPAAHAIQQIHRLIELHGLEDWVVYVPNYRLALAQALVAGADVWVNTPIRGQEASGTSGMKAGANGALLISTDDGWMAEVNWDDVGWILPDAHTDKYFYQALEQQILPMYQPASAHEVPAEWVWRMRRTMERCWQQFSSARMLAEYQERLYQPVAED